ncbi:cysteine-rich RLK (RECEPTOR-like protein kinase) 8 [Abeliophyllum distichum]|uniref:Cysteine-rich RLK (RECEPTOR-like protein kinase) 8 n=1 Tax=Abeliophyllum distichum TaxID=126358 RepID=A0ABD1UIA0_9LAMI
MKQVPYASAVGSLVYAMLCTRPDICYTVGIVSRYQSNPGPEHWTAVKHILKYLRRTRDYMLVYSAPDLVPTGYTDSNFQADRDSRKSTSGSVLTLGGGAVVWRSIKQSCIADSTMEKEYVAACEAAKEAVWLRKFLLDLEVVPSASQAILYTVITVEWWQMQKSPEAINVGNTLNENITWLEISFNEEMLQCARLHMQKILLTPLPKAYQLRVLRGILKIWVYLTCLIYSRASGRFVRLCLPVE